MQPKKTKYRKQFKGRNTGMAKRGTMVNFGAFGLKAVELGRLSGKHLEAARRTLTRALKRGGQVWIRVFPDKPVSKKPLEVRQGKGKGNVESWVALIQPGRILFEIEGVNEELAREAFKLAAAKLPVKSTFVARTVM